MQIYSGVSDMPLALAVFLAHDNYDHNDDLFTISATTLMKPLKQIILSTRIGGGTGLVPIHDMMKSRTGSAIHDAIEAAWGSSKLVETLGLLGYPPGVAKRVKFNPTPEFLEANPSTIPVYMEQRMSKKVGKWTVTGKYDFIGDGMVQDFKTTSTFTYTKQVNATKYIQQGSIYRWLDPKKITKDVMQIHYIFTDWKANRAKQDQAYPQKSTHTQTFDLMSVAETDRFVTNKLAMIDKYWDAAEEDIPDCTDEDLWRSEPVFKYYKNPAASGRSTKNFDSAHDAYMRLAQDGHVGKVVEVPGQVMACKYCSAFPLCSQKDALVASGHLVL